MSGDVNKDMRILVVDDYPTMVHIIKTMLKQFGYNNVDDAPNGKIALEKIAANNYGLIFSDWNMGPISGVDMLKKVRDAGNKVPFVILTAENKTAKKAHAFAIGASDFLVKPFTIETLKLSLTCALND